MKLRLLIVALVPLFFLVSWTVSQPKNTHLSQGLTQIRCKSENLPKFQGCSPPPFCGRFIQDQFLDTNQVQLLLNLAKTGMSVGGGSGPPTVLDLLSGAVSYGDHFIDVYKAMSRNPETRFEPEALLFYHNLTQHIKHVVSKVFKVEPEKLFLTSPAFFSRIQGEVKAVTMHDEYWHEHIDREQYGSFAYTGLLYLNEQGTDYQGGEFLFVDREQNQNKSYVVRPTTGRLLLFTSGSENVHYVQQVTQGTRYALTIAFTCDPAKSSEEALRKRIPLASRKG